ncbi:MAG: hypothetical protein ACLFVJ_19825, partial [Persicimonas sp.]
RRRKSRQEPRTNHQEQVGHRETMRRVWQTRKPQDFRVSTYVEVSQCGMAGLVYWLMAITGSAVWIPLTLVGARDLHRGLAD